MTEYIPVAGYVPVSIWFFWREILPRIRNGRKNGITAQAHLDIEKIFDESLDKKLAPKFDTQIAILNELKQSSKETRDGVVRLVALAEK
jgi:hypothetical protein